MDTADKRRRNNILKNSLKFFSWISIIPRAAGKLNRQQLFFCWINEKKTLSKFITFHAFINTQWKVPLYYASDYVQSGLGMQNDKKGNRSTETSPGYPRFSEHVSSALQWCSTCFRYSWQSWVWRMVIIIFYLCLDAAAADLTQCSVWCCSPCRWWRYGGWYYYSNVLLYLSEGHTLV